MRAAAEGATVSPGHPRVLLEVLAERRGRGDPAGVAGIPERCRGPATPPGHVLGPRSPPLKRVLKP